MALDLAAAPWVCVHVRSGFGRQRQLAGGPDGHLSHDAKDILHAVLSQAIAKRGHRAVTRIPQLIAFCVDALAFTNIALAPNAIVCGSGPVTS